MNSLAVYLLSFFRQSSLESSKCLYSCSAFLVFVKVPATFPGVFEATASTFRDLKAKKAKKQPQKFSEKVQRPLFRGFSLSKTFEVKKESSADPEGQTFSESRLFAEKKAFAWKKARFAFTSEYSLYYSRHALEWIDYRISERRSLFTEWKLSGTPFAKSCSSFSLKLNLNQLVGWTELFCI